MGKYVNEIVCHRLRNTHGERKTVQDWPHYTQPEYLKNEMYSTPPFDIGAPNWASATIYAQRTNTTRRKEEKRVLTEPRPFVVIKIKRDVDGGVAARDESQGVTAVFVNINQDYDAVRWKVFQKV